MRLRQQLWAAYDYDRERYYQSYEPDDGDYMYFQESGMEAFVKMVRKLERGWKTGLESYWHAGAKTLQSLGADLSGDTRQSKVLFVSLDFEGDPQDPKRRLTEIGIAELDSAHLLCQNESDITGFNFALRKHRKRKFLFGNTIRLSSEILHRTIDEHFQELHRQHPDHEIILVSHGTTNEIRILDGIGVSLESLPISGVIDTCRLARDVLGSRGSLESLLATLHIPVRVDLLHCAGNDAHFTLQALLALLQTRYGDRYGQLERLARQDCPLQPCCFVERTEEDWADHLEFAACLI